MSTRIHPWIYLKEEITRRWWTQKQFAEFIWKKVSEVNELLKWKRNITVQRDIILSALFDDPEKKWINLQIEYEYDTVKQSMNLDKVNSIKSHKQIIKKHEIFEDF